SLVYRGFEAWVVVDQKPLPHFGVECKESTREVSAWIPSEVGQIHVCYRKAEGDKRAFTATLYLTGTNFSRRHDDAYVDHPSSAGIGEIKLVFRTVEVTHKHPPTPQFIPAELLETPKIHERSKKGLVHQIQFSESKTRPYFIRGSSSTKTVGSRRIFIFKYRSLDLLQANGIAPCPTPPAETIEDVGRSTEKQSGDDDEDEIMKARALLAELEERRNQKRARKEMGDPQIRVKNESTSQFALGDVIDLT
ncbi:hypothetical protein BJ912DRAFT_979859, partial [Pholiota molesta]